MRERVAGLAAAEGALRAATSSCYPQACTGNHMVAPALVETAHRECLSLIHISEPTRLALI
eukprot:4846839-Alexandrium_andersonii.AAC.1